MKNIKMMALIGILGIGTISGQIARVDQEVYGMDCAPCAYGLERGLKKMDGLQEVRVSLNDGKAYLGLAEKNDLTLRSIQEEVKKNGFSAKKAEVVLMGNATKEDGQWYIETDNERFAVSQDTSIELVQKLAVGRTTLSGTVQDEDDDNLSDQWEIILSKIE
ncbi:MULTISPECIES: heavy-metal-associated domain-containing protein [Flavobacteriaceae]|jgi:cation transport ATPase|uniref:Heavy-metal-associated domain-containing protein n=4 Tax=Flagellimonas TaxID=444459 RepID=A0A1H2RBV6_9FLAO|nr:MULTISPECIES: heavy metal-associated domain-containing protein [Allomuricauda]MCR9262505.1 heavy-metal-associated domain-containing protein [Flavobacteriaceae bacterium]UBZ14505.1 heavy-metal-associated domain-containing protein [Allomuricauda aquimarina]MCK0160115.1 heavy-metal-associated domain-containing protein [Muricauda sp. F6463D]MEC3965604.1 heavy metal-associated domain-containing protein [Muricauda sp. SYSU M86414]MEC4265470.1 heavy metal-associated domain-containing protein [Muri